jgi:hypothetical protein
MNPKRPRIFHLLALCAVCTVISTIAFSQDNVNNTGRAVPRLAVRPPRPVPSNVQVPSGLLPEWNGSFVYNGTQYDYVMVGADPSSNQGALITTWIVPVKIVLSTGETFDPLSGGTSSALARTVLSPIFDNSTTYSQGGVDVGTTQYIDAFQRANFWSIVSNNPNSHLLLGGPNSHTAILPELTLNVPASDGQVGTPFGHQVAEVDINYFDNQVNSYLTQNHVINPTGLPIFETTNTYLTEQGCCIGGYHSAVGAQTYTVFTYITYPGEFAQDVSALSAELGDWADDPLYPAPNSTPCGGMAVADPAGTSYPYQLHGFTYHLQDLAFLRYFGGPADGSVNDWWTFQGYPFTQPCQNGD